MLPIFDKLRSAGWSIKAVVLVVATALFIGLVAPVSYFLKGGDGVFASAAAGGLCLLGGLTALLVALPFQKTSIAWAGVLAGMLPRMFLPLGLGLLLYFRVGPLASGGLLYYLLVFYPVMLALGTAMSLPPTAARPPAPVPRSPPREP